MPGAWTFLLFFNRPDGSCGIKKSGPIILSVSLVRANVDGSNCRCFVECFSCFGCGVFSTSKSPRDFGMAKLSKSEPGQVLSPYIYTFEMSRARTIGKRLTNLPIIPIPITRSGNNKPKSLQKTKRTFQPNLTRVDWPVTVLGGPVPIDRAKEQSLPKLEGILMQVRKIRDVEKAGGIEGLLVGSTSVNRGSC